MLKSYRDRMDALEAARCRVSGVAHRFHKVIPRLVLAGWGMVAGGRAIGPRWVWVSVGAALVTAGRYAGLSRG